MSYLASTLVALVALEHIYILILEMFLWTTPTGRRAFGMKPDQAEATKVMAANQGLGANPLVATQTKRGAVGVGEVGVSRLVRSIV